MVLQHPLLVPIAVCRRSGIVYNIHISSTETVSSINLPRRNALKLLGGAIAASCLDLPTLLFAQEHIQIAGREARISISTISAHTVRIRIAGIGTAPGAQTDDGAVLEAPLRSSTTRNSVA